MIYVCNLIRNFELLTVHPGIQYTRSTQAAVIYETLIYGLQL